MYSILHDYQLVLIPLLCLIITQAIKSVIDLKQGFPSSLNSYGGMPSAHSALFASLLVMSWLIFGMASFEFAVSFVLYLVIVRDAAGIRQHLGRHGQMLKDLIIEHQKDHHHKIPHDKIVTRLGHTVPQIIAGTISGAALTSLFYWLANR